MAPGRNDFGAGGICLRLPQVGEHIPSTPRQRHAENPKPYAESNFGIRHIIEQHPDSSRKIVYDSANWRKGSDPDRLAPKRDGGEQRMQFHGRCASQLGEVENPQSHPPTRIGPYAIGCRS